jgi:hypothetical protein
VQQKAQMDSPKPSKRPRLSGEFTPLHSSAAPSTVSPIADDDPSSKVQTMAVGEASTLTPVSDVRPTNEEDVEEDEIGQETRRNEEPSDEADISMTEDHEQNDAENRRTDHDWHWSEPTARPDAIHRHLNADMGDLYKLSSTRKDSLFSCAHSFVIKHGD